MLKSGLIIGVVMIVLALGSTLVSPLCAPCVALLAGLGAGYLAGVFDKPLASGASAKSGAAAGALGGIGAVIGGTLGGVGNMLIVGPDKTAALLRQMGLPADSSGPSYYLGALGAPCCIGLFNVALMAGLGALGGILWYQISGKKATTPPMP